MFLSDKYEYTEGQKRLLALADMTEKLSREQFDMETIKRHSHCGTVGCVLGWAAELNVLGPRFAMVHVTSHYELRFDGEALRWLPSDWLTHPMMLPVLDFFDLPNMDAFNQLFAGEHYCRVKNWLKDPNTGWTPTSKAAQIRAFVKSQVEERIAA